MTPEVQDIQVKTPDVNIENSESSIGDFSENLKQKELELGWTSAQTEAVREVFENIQKDLSNANNKTININEYIESISGRFFIKEFQNINKSEIHNFYKEKIVDFFKEKGEELTITSYNSLLIKEKEVSDKEKEVSDKEKEVSDKEKEIQSIKQENKIIETENIIREQKSKLEEQKSKLEEQKSKLEEQKDKSKEQKDKSKEQKDLTYKQETAEIAQETLEYTKTLKSFQETKSNYDQLDPKFREKVENHTNTPKQKQLKSSIQDKLALKGFNESEQEEFSKQYLTFYIAKSVYGDDLSQIPGAKQFESSFESLRKEIGIIETISDISQNTDFSQNAQNIISSYPSIKKASEQANPNIDNIQIPNQEIFKYMSDSTIQTIQNEQNKLTKKYPDSDLFQENSFLIKETINPKNNQQAIDLKNYNNFIQENINTTQAKIELAKETIKQQITIAPIVGISKYIDTNLGDEQIAKSFSPQEGQGFSLENNILEISGNIDGKAIKIRQNLKNGSLENNQLQSNSYLSIDSQNTISMNNNTMQDTGVVLPNQNILNQHSQLRIQKNLQNEIKNSENISVSIANNLGNTLQKNYGQQSIVRDRLSTNIQKNISKQNTINFMQKTLGNIQESDLSVASLGGQNSENLRIMRGIITGIAHLSKEECLQLDKNLKKVETIIDKLEYNSELANDPILKNFNRNQIIQNKKQRKLSQKESNPSFTFFDYLIKNEGGKEKLQIQDFNKLISKREKNETINNNTHFLSTNFRSKFEEPKEKEDAEIALNEFLKQQR